ncbi:tannase/feruloyl esterase family alpha/beta hydrolase [Nocardia xishanensis]
MTTTPTGAHVRRRRTALAAAGLLLAVGTLAACGTNASHSSEARACSDMPGMNIPASAIGLPTSGGEVTGAKIVPAKGTGESATVEYCEVDAALHPVDPTASDIKMRIALPTNWNGKSWMFGGGGYNGSIRKVDRWDSAVGGQPLMSRGYAIFSSNGGHDGYYTDASFALKDNQEEIRNYVGDALKKTRDAAMLLMQTHYGKTPERPYFVGGSNGGREALKVASAWPADFAGVVSQAPGTGAASALDLGLVHLIKVFSQPGAWPNPAKQRLLYSAVMNGCDGNDGARDGIISNPEGCHFDPHVLRCPDGTDTGDSCLSDAQIDAVIAADAPVKFNPLPNGESGYPGFPFLSGMELRSHGDGAYGIGPKPPANAMTDNDNGVIMNFPANWVRYFVTKDPNYPVLNFDPEQWRQRIDDLNKLGGYNNPDLREFAKAGGKLLLMNGTSDEIISYRATADYFNRMKAIVGPEAVHDFARLYLIPGLDHWDRLQAFNPRWDFATALDNWVHNGQAPQNQVMTDIGKEGPGRTRPVCEYPTWPKYNGTGDINQASSFTCATS